MPWLTSNERLKIKIPRAELPEGVRKPSEELRKGNQPRGQQGKGRNRARKDGNNKPNANARPKHNNRKPNNASAPKRNEKTATGKPQDKVDNRPAAKRRPQKSGNGR